MEGASFITVLLLIGIMPSKGGESRDRHQDNGGHRGSPLPDEATDMTP